MAKQLGIDLSIKADASQATQEIKSLQQNLYKIMNMSTGSGGLSEEMKQSAAAAKELQYQLNQAYNSSTGNIDLSKLNTSLQKSNSSITQLSNNLLQSGQVGKQAFIDLASAISKADYPMFKLNSKLTEMWTTLKNTARWQLSSSMLHGFMGAVQQATSYAQRLDTSLNNIRIVTGMSSSEMDKFAESANKAAKVLSTTTTEYTDASLIFFQQGLSGKDVEERTAITIKMAQAAGESATDISSYMTAIWNNFEGGKETLQSFADSMVKLGADTAASSSEIATSLEKFASIGETVGLSFDYATAAATTIIDKTRAGAETVGTALKTIFARLEGLKLGEILEDGVDLNKYSEALKVVGVEILDLNGNLRDADDIIFDLGSTWDTLTRSQQMALAQTVAGAKQYTQLMSLMNNFDSFLENVDRSKNADGSLEEQAEIAVDSWEKAKNRVQAAAEGIYESLIDRNFMKNYNNILADALTGIDKLIESFGGLGGVVSAAGSLILSLVSHKIQPAIQGLVINIQNLFTSAQTRAQQLVSTMQTKTKEQISTGNYDSSQVQSLKNSSLLAEARARLTIASRRLTDEEKQLYQIDIENIEMQSKKAQAIADIVAGLEKEVDTLILSADATDSNTEATRVYNQMLKEQRELSDEAFSRAISNDGTKTDFNEYFAAEQAIAELQDRKMVLNETINESVQILLQDYEAMTKAGTSVEEFKVHTSEAIGPWKKLIGELKDGELDAGNLDSYKASLEMIGKSMPSVMKQSKKMQEVLKNAFDADSLDAFKAALEGADGAFDDIVIDGKNLGRILKELNPKSFQELELILKKIKKEETELKTVNEELVNSLNNFKPEHLVTGVESLTSAAAAMGQIAMIGSSISSIIDAFKNEDMSFGERLSTVLMSLSMIIPGVITSITSLGHALEGTAAKEMVLSAAVKLSQGDMDITAAKLILLTKAKEAELTVDQTAAIVKASLATAIKSEGISVDRNTLSTVKNEVAKKVLNKATKEEIIDYIRSTLRCNEETAAKIANKIATDSLKTSISSLLIPITLVVAAMGLLIGAVKAYNKAQEEKAQKERDDRSAQIDSIMEEAEAYKTAREEYQELLKTYNEAITSSDGTVQAQKAIADATWDLCEALGIEIDYLDRLQGKTEGYNTKILEKQLNEAETGIEQFKKDKAVVETGIADSYVENEVKFEDGSSAFESVYTNTSGGGNRITDKLDSKFYIPDTGITYSDSADKKIIEIMNEFLASDFKNKDILKTSKVYDGTLQFEEDSSNSQIYEVINQMTDYIREKTEGSDNTRKNSEIFNWYDDLLGYGKETFDKLGELDNVAEEYIEEYAVSKTQLDSGKMFQEIETATEYNQMRQKLIENIYKGYEQLGHSKGNLPLGDFESETELITSLVDKYIENYDNLLQLDNLKDIAKKTNIPEEEIQGLFEDYGEVIFDSRIDFDEKMSREELENILKILQGDVETKKIQTKVTVVSDAKSKLSKDMSASDYNKFESESGIAWGEKDEILDKEIISYGQFLSLTYEQQVAYLEGLEQEYLTKQSAALTESLTNARTILQNYYTELETLKEKGEDTTEIEATISEMEAYFQELQGTIVSINSGVLNSVETFDQLIQKIQEIQNAGGEVTLAEYGNALVNLAENYDNCAEEIENWERALFSGDVKAQEAAADALAGAVIIGEAAEKYDLEADAVEVQADRMAKAYNLSAEEAAKLAVKNQRMNKGIKSLTDNWEDWKKELNRTDKLTTDYADAVADVTSAIIDLVGACDDLELPDEFFNDENMVLIEQAANGDVEAINKLGAAVAETTVEALEFNQALADLAASTWKLNDLEVEPKISSNWATQFETDKKTVLTGIQQIKTGAIASGNAMDAEWVAALNRMALATGMSVEEMNGLLGSLGVQAKVETTYVKQEMEVPTYEEHVVPQAPVTVTQGEDENGKPNEVTYTPVKKYTVPGPPMKVEGFAAVAQVSTEDNPMTLDIDTSMASPTTPTASSAASYSGNRGSVSPSSTESDDSGSDGGSSSEPESIDKTDKDDVVERYKEINDSLDDISRAYDKVSNAADRAYGKNRISQLKQVNSVLQQEIGLLKQKTAEAQTYFEQDQANLRKAASAAGISLGFDPTTGNITNYTSQMNGLYARLESAEAGADPSNFSTKDEQDAYIEKYITPLKELIEELESAYGKYEETKELLQDLDTEIEDKFYEWQDNNAEILTYTLELKLEIEDRELTKIEFLLSRMEDDFYSMAEVAALMTGSVTKNGQLINGQYASYVQNLKSYEDQIASLETAFKNGKISEQAYAEGLQNIYDGIYEQLGSIDELDKAMMNYYGDTIAAAQEEMSKYTDQMEHHNSVLEHYKSLMELMGKSTDYKKMGTILKGQVETAKNYMKVSKQTMEMYQEQAEEKLALYQDALRKGDSAAAELYKKEYEAALQASQEAQEEYLSNAEAYAEALKAVLENELLEFARELENSLTKGTSFEQLSNKLSRAKSLQEEYLTTTNKIYETNKLMNTAQMEIDKTTNTVAKNRLKQFIEETNQLQSKNKLSQFELDIQQAKYDLLLAEIALEEAQNAKSTVRLQRDTEGNFGYVYTADETKIAEAEQKLADEQNRLYNISLEGANEYTEKYQQTLNEMYDTLTDLQTQYLEGAFESEEEYHRAVEEAKEYYYEKLMQYSSLHAIALTTDSRVIEEAWSKDFNTMTYSTEIWKKNVNTYVGQVDQAFKDWKKNMKNLEKELKLNDIKDAVGKITKESEKLTKTLTKNGGVIDSIEKEFDAVSKVTSAWAEQREVIASLIGDYQELANTVQNTLDTMSEDEESDNQNPDNSSSSSGSGSGNGDGNLKVGDEVIFESGYYYYDSEGTRPLGNRGLGKKAKITIINSGAEYPIHLQSNDGAYGWVQKSQISGYDTGGYTGEWGPDGRLAVLHEKELILNKEDTANLLKTIELLRETYSKGQDSLDSSALFDLLKISHGEITSLYENELISLSQDMNSLAADTILKSNMGYSDLLSSYKDSLINLNDEMTDNFSNMNSTYERMSNSYEKELENLNKTLEDGSDSYTKEYHNLVQEYSGQMLNINKSMYSQLIDFETEHKDLVIKYEQKFEETSTEVLKNIESTAAIGGTQSKIMPVQQLNADQQISLNSIENISKDMIQAILKSIDMQQINAQLGGLLNSPIVANKENNMNLEQSVKIDASFPGISDRHELEEAFESLINRASQYANRPKN